jgi:hypothetical protein
MPKTSILFGTALAMSLLSNAATRAELLPLPQTDYEASVRGPVFAGASVVIRHHNGMLLIRGTRGTTTVGLVLVDLTRRVMTYMGERDGKKMAMEAPAALLGSTGLAASRDEAAHIVGRDVVAGEPCEIWRHVNDNPFAHRDAPKEFVSDSCFARDGILLRTTRTDVAEPVFEITKLERKAQDPSLFVVPSDYTLHPLQPAEQDTDDGH